MGHQEDSSLFFALDLEEKGDLVGFTNDKDGFEVKDELQERNPRGDLAASDGDDQRAVGDRGRRGLACVL